MSAGLPDPVTFSNRACAGITQEVFFPDPRSTDVDRARAFCLGCPRLRACAAWAVPLAESGALTGCMIGGVMLPGAWQSQKQRTAAAVELADVAAHGVAALMKAGAA